MSKQNAEDLRDKIARSGWSLRELPIRKANSNEIRAWKMIAVKKDRSLILEGTSLQLALEAVCKNLGLIGR